MRVRTLGLSILALGILIGAGGCTSSDSPTSPSARFNAGKGGSMGGVNRDTTRSTISGGYMGGVMGTGNDDGATVSGGYMGGVN
jgi:hypothetical protein